MIGLSLHELEIKLGRLLTDEELNTVIQEPCNRTIIVECKTYDFYEE